MQSAPYSWLSYTIILNRMQGKRDVDVSFHHIFCIQKPASLTTHHVNDVVQNVLYLFYFLELPFYNPFIYNCLFYSIIVHLQVKKYTYLSHCMNRPDIYHSANIGHILFYIKYPIIVVVRHLHEPIFRPFLLLLRFHEHDEHMHLYRQVSNDQQPSFRSHQPIYQ